MRGPHPDAEQVFQQSARGRSHGLQPETVRRWPEAGNGFAVPLCICSAIVAVNCSMQGNGRGVASGRHAIALTIHAGKWPVPSLSYCGQVRKSSGPWQREKEHAPMPLDEKTTTELEAAAFRRLLEHLRSRTDVQNIDLMNLAGFCRNCLSNWMKEAADARGVAMSKDESRETIYGMPYEEWKAKHQKEAAKDQQAAFEKTGHRH